MTTINFATQTFIPCHSGCLFWPSEKTLIISDLHFEKSTSFAPRGTFLPPHDTTATLEKLNEACQKFTPETIIFLGDVFHDQTSLQRLNHANLKTIQHVLNTHNIIWIEGNHDTNHAPKGITALTRHTIQNITFTHIATDSTEPEISGHYHPAVTLKHKGQKLRRPCFIKNKTKIICPSFGTLTGGLDITDNIYKDIIGKDFEIYALGHHKIHKVPNGKIG